MKMIQNKKTKSPQESGDHEIGLIDSFGAAFPAFRTLASEYTAIALITTTKNVSPALMKIATNNARGRNTKKTFVEYARPVATVAVGADITSPDVVATEDVDVSPTADPQLEQNFEPGESGTPQ